MYFNSTQQKYWTFADENQLKEAWKKCDYDYRSNYCSLDDRRNILDNDFFLTFEEHQALVEYYIQELKRFCFAFKPSMPNNVIGTACTYMRRFYTVTSAMEYHPRVIYLVCGWFACKIEEFNVSIEEYLLNTTSGQPVKNEQWKAVAGMEMAVMERLNFDFTIHNPFRPLEGFFIDIKTRFPEILKSNTEQIRSEAVNYLMSMLGSSITLLYSPSQMAIAALLHSASKLKINVDKYLKKILLEGVEKEQVENLIRKIRSIRLKQQQNKKEKKMPIEPILAKITSCYKKENDPTAKEWIETIVPTDSEDEEANDIEKGRKKRSKQEEEEGPSRKRPRPTPSNEPAPFLLNF